MEAKKIKSAITLAGKSQCEIAKELGTSPQNFNTKLKRNTFTDGELEQIAEALGAKYKCFFEFPDGTKI